MEFILKVLSNRRVGGCKNVLSLFFDFAGRIFGKSMLPTIALKKHMPLSLTY